MNSDYGQVLEQGRVLQRGPASIPQQGLSDIYYNEGQFKLLMR